MALCISDLQEDKSVQKHSGGKRTYAKKLNKGKTWDNRRSGIENHHDNIKTHWGKKQHQSLLKMRTESMQQYKEKRKEQVQKYLAGEFAYYFTLWVNLLYCSLQFS